MALTNTFERGVNGNTIAAADAGSPDKWDAVTIASGSAITYDNAHAAHGSLAAKIVTGGTNVPAHLTWSTAFGTQTDHYGRLYLYRTANPVGGAADLVEIWNGATIVAIVQVLGTGTLKIIASGVSVGTGAVSMSLNQWVRIEWHVVHSTTAGMIEAKLFNTVESTTASETLTSTSNRNTGAQGTSVRLGEGNLRTATIWIDEPTAGATSYPGPFAGATYVLTGAVAIGNSILSGTDVLTAAESGLAKVDDSKLAGADAAIYNRAGSAISDFSSSGAEVFAAAETGKAISDLDPAGADAVTLAETGLVRSDDVKLSGRDVFRPAETGAPVTAVTASAPDVFTASETGAPVSDLDLSGADVSTLAESGAGVSDLNPSAADAVTATESGVAVTHLNPSGSDALVAAETGAVVALLGPTRASDDFERADGPLGAPYVLLSADDTFPVTQLAIGGGKVINTSPAGHRSECDVARSDIVATDKTVSLRLPTVPDLVSLFGRIQDIGTNAYEFSAYCFNYDKFDNAWQIVRFVFDGVSISGIVLASGDLPSPPSDDDAPSFVLAGSLLIALVNGVELGRVSDTAIPGAGYPGFGIFNDPSDGGSIDDFRVVYGTAGLSGADVFEPSETGAVVSEASARGTDVVVVAETGAAVSDLDLAGADTTTFAESGRAESERVASGTDAATASESGSASTEAVSRGDDVFAATESGANASEFVARGADSFQGAETGAAASESDLSGADVYESRNAGNVVADFLLSGADTFTATEAGSGVSTVTISGPADVVTYRFLPGKTIIGAARLVVARGRARLVLGEGDARLVVAAGRARLVAPESPARQPEADSQAVRR